MKTGRPLPLAGQLIFLLVLTVVAAQIPASVMFGLQSTRVGRVAFTLRMGDRVAALVHVLGVVPPELVPRVISAYGFPLSRFSLDAAARIPDGTMGRDEKEIASFLAQRLRFEPDRVRIELDDAAGAMVRYLPWRATQKTLLVSVHLADGRWLNGQSRILMPDAPYWLQIGLLQLGAAILAILVTIGLGLRHIIRPVTALADAAEHAGRGVAIAPLPERGPRELRTMTASFNAMQARLRAFVDDRTRMLGAISHDLRTPLSSLWLRAELVDDAELRDNMVRLVVEMRDMVDATLAFARDDARGASGAVDLAQLVRAVVDDQRALGHEVLLEGPETVPFHGRPAALRRALDNVVGNAVRYGERARVALVQDADAVRIRIDDDGPGLPPDRVEDMFQPFVRLEGSRNQQTGGTGLGLAIARSAVREHGGDVSLVNRSGGGLRAEIALPLSASPVSPAAPKALARVADDHDGRVVLLP